MKANKLFAKRNILILEHNYKEIKKIARMSSKDSKYDAEATSKAQSFLLGYGAPKGYKNTWEADSDTWNYHTFTSKNNIPGTLYDIKVHGYIPSTGMIGSLYSIYYNIKHNIEESDELPARKVVREWLMNPETIIKKI